MARKVELSHLASHRGLGSVYREGILYKFLILLVLIRHFKPILLPPLIVFSCPVNEILDIKLALFVSVKSRIHIKHLESSLQWNRSHLKRHYLVCHQNCFLPPVFSMLLAYCTSKQLWILSCGGVFLVPMKSYLLSTLELLSASIPLLYICP